VHINEVCRETGTDCKTQLVHAHCKRDLEVSIQSVHIYSVRGETSNMYRKGSAAERWHSEKGSHTANSTGTTLQSNLHHYNALSLHKPRGWAIALRWRSLILCDHIWNVLFRSTSLNSTKPVNSNMSFGTGFAVPYDDQIIKWSTELYYLTWRN
jgi:hypothetical protein